MRIGFLINCVFVAATSTAYAVKPTLVEIPGRTMGTTYSVKYFRSDSPSHQESIGRAIAEQLSKLDGQLSTYRPDSELARFAKAPADFWFAVSPETAKVVAFAQHQHQRTAGVSDITIGPALRLWGFGPGSRRNGFRGPPTTAEIEAAIQQIGADKLHVRLDPPTLKKTTAGLEVDVSSMGPGYGVDLICSLLRERGITDAIVEIGGEVRAMGKRPDGTAWRVGIERPPHEGGGGFAQIIELNNLALATSGDFGDGRVLNGVRYSHTIDPRTARALRYRGACVTVLADTCLEADSLGTPLMVMGQEAGYEWCVNHNTAALFQQISADGKGIITLATPAFEQFVAGVEGDRYGAAAE